MYAAKAAYIFPWYIWVLLLILFLGFFSPIFKIDYSELHFFIVHSAYFKNKESGNTLLFMIQGPF